MMPIVIKRYYKLDISRTQNRRVNYIFRVDKDTGDGWDISELSIFKNSNLLPMLEKTRLSSTYVLMRYMNPKREGYINEIFLFKIAKLRLWLT